MSTLPPCPSSKCRRPIGNCARLQEVMSRNVVSVAADTSIKDSLDLLVGRHIHHLLIHDDKQTVGILSDRDILKAISPFLGKLSERAMDAQTVERPVHQIMTRRLICAPPRATLCEGTELMLKHGISCVVVGTPNAIVGIVTWRDLLKAAYPGR